MKLAAPVPAQGHQEEAGGRMARRAHLTVGGVVEPAQEVVHERGVGADALGARRTVRMAGLEALVRGGDVLPQNVEAYATPPLWPLRLGADEVPPHRRLGATQAAHQRLNHRKIDASMGGMGCQTRVSIGAATIDRLARRLV